MHELKSTALNGCYNIWPETHEDFYSYPNQQDKNICQCLPIKYYEQKSQI